jgi:deoxyribonuclease-4
LKALYLHAAYLVNLASPDEMIRIKSIKSLTDHFRIANMLRAQGLIFHIGSGREAPRDEAIRNVIQGMQAVLHEVSGETLLLMENSAGGGGKIGSTIADLTLLLKGVDSKRVGICFDTAHAFEAGVFSYEPQAVKLFFDEWQKQLGLESLRVMHLNDSKTVFNSHHDRHENIGKGHIGLPGFKVLARETRIRHLPWILEVPGFQGEGPDKENIDIVKSLFS